MPEQTLIRRQFSRVGLALFLFLLVQQVVVVIVAVAVELINPALAEASWYLWGISYLPLYLVAFPVFLLVIRTVPDTDAELPTGWLSRRETLGAREVLLLYLAMIGITYAFNFFSTWLSGLIEQLKGRPVENFLQTTVESSNPWVTLLAVVIVAPVMEEIVFRWLTYKKLIVFGEKTYLLVSALLFSLFHVNFYQLLYTFVLGLILAWTVCRTKSIASSILLHFLLNLTGSGVGTLLMAYASETAVGIWGICILALMAVGLVIVLAWLFRGGLRRLRPEPAVRHASGGLIFGNPGMILYLLLTVGFAVIAILA